MAEETSRTRTVSWEDPSLGAKGGSQLSGLEYLSSITEGKFPAPPVGVLLGFTILEISPGRAVFGMEPAEYHYNPIGSVHGGVLSTLLDSALGCSIHSTLPPGKGYTTLELHVNFIRPVTVKTGFIKCEGKIIHVGGQVATAEAKIVDEAGKLYAHATTTCLIFQHR